jgi:hypothetical protein
MVESQSAYSVGDVFFVGGDRLSDLNDRVTEQAEQDGEDKLGNRLN